MSTNPNLISKVSKDKDNFENVYNVITKFTGLCHLFCKLMIVHNDYNLSIIKKYNPEDSENLSDEDKNTLDLLSLKLDLLSLIEKILLILFKKFPHSILKLSEQKRLINEKNGHKSINREILKGVFNKIKDNQYLELFFIGTKRSISDPLCECHTTIIFKTIENRIECYNFFDSNHGLFQSENVEDMASIIDCTVLNFFDKCTDLGIVDIGKLLPRDKITLQVMEQINKQQTLLLQS